MKINEDGKMTISLFVNNNLSDSAQFVALLDQLVTHPCMSRLDPMAKKSGAQWLLAQFEQLQNK